MGVGKADTSNGLQDHLAQITGGGVGTLRQQFEQVVANLASLGVRRLAGLGIAGLVITAAVMAGAYYLNRPEFELLYSGVSPLDASRMGAVLRENGISFDLSSDGGTLLVQRGSGPAARMLLAEKGLPGSSNAGYELFDKMGSLGLTSFMQEVTRVRALEGELARSIQTLKGIRAARVHIVMPETSALRGMKQPPSASVVIRTEQTGDSSTSDAIRNLVSAAVPGMSADQVRVMTTEGLVLAGGGDGASASQGRQAQLEKQLGRDLQENVRQTLAPYLGVGNFQISIAARLNTDKRQINETVYDPNTRVERSVRTVRETGSQTAAAPANVTVEQNVPGEQKPGQKGDPTRKANERKEETTNFEVGTKTISTTNEGYRIEAINAAVVVNRKQLLVTLGPNPAPGALEARLQEIERMVSTAAGIDNKRGDRVNVTAVDFLPGAETLEPSPAPAIIDLVIQQSGAYLKALATIVAALIIVWFGLRPIGRQLLLPPPEPAVAAIASGGGLSIGDASLDALPPMANALPELPGLALAGPPFEDEGEASPLDKMVSGKEEQVAILLKQLLKGARS